jgi:uncharacterized membrane protein YgcG
MNAFFNGKVAGAFAGTLLTLSLATSGSAAPLSVAAPTLMASHRQIVEAKYVRHTYVHHYATVRHYQHYRHFPGVVPAIGGLLAYGLGSVFGPSCPYDYYYYDYPYCGPYYGGSYYYGPSYGYGYRRGFRRRVFVGRPGYFPGREFAGHPGGGGFRGSFAPGGFGRGGGSFGRGGGGPGRGHR